jgi:hypothetical protein
MARPLRWLGLSALAALTVAAVTGCALIGFAASKLGSSEIQASYKGLANQHVGVMTWADRAVKFYYSYMGSDVQSEVSALIVDRLHTAADPKTKLEELANMTLLDPKQVYRWQKNHPELDNRPAAEIAPQLAAAIPMTRLIHIEVQEFTTRDANTEFLLRGHAVVNLRVIEIDPAAQSARQAYEELGMQIAYPPKAADGVPPTQTFNEDTVRRGLIDAIATEVAIRFFSHPEQ